MTFRVIFFVINLLLYNFVSKAEIIDSKIAGLGTAWSGPIFFTSAGRPIPGTTFTIRANAGDNTTLIAKDINDKILFEYKPVSRNKIFSTTVALEKNGFRTFDHGEEMEHFTVQVRPFNIGITQGGLKSAYLAFNEPLWALQHLHKHVRIDLFGAGIPVPFMFNLIDYNTNQIVFEDYIIIIGEVIDALYIQLELKDIENKITALHLRLKTKVTSPNDPVLNIGTHSIQQPFNTYNDTTLDRGLYLNQRFSIALVREYLGWKIYINGELYHYFFDRYSPVFVKYLELYGNSRKEGGWVLIKLIRKHS